MASKETPTVTPTNAVHTFSVEGVRAVAKAAGLSQELSEDVCATVATSAEYRVRQVVEEAKKYARAAKRFRLTPEDINLALRQLVASPVYGVVPDNAQVRSRLGVLARGGGNTAPIDLDVLCNVDLPPVPLEPAVGVHWLAVNGTMPSIPENIEVFPPTSYDTELSVGTEVGGIHKRKRVGATESVAAAKTIAATVPLDKNPKTGVRYHNLSQEQQMYMQRLQKDVVGDTLGGGGSSPGRGRGGTTRQQFDLACTRALRRLQFDPKGTLQPLLPYMVQWLATSAHQNLRNLRLLASLIRASKAIICNSNLELELYLDQIMPILLTCVVSKRLCEDEAVEDHWQLRRLAAQTVSDACEKFGAKYPKLQLRILKTYRKALTNPKTPWTTAYGALAGLYHLGEFSVESVLLPIAETFLARLGPVVETGKEDGTEAGTDASRQIAQSNAVQCNGALLQAAGLLYGKGGSSETVKERLLTLFGDKLLPYCQQESNSVQGGRKAVHLNPVNMLF